jgi:DNA invertase Pin-like site-specific DNA recombinase
VRLTDAGCSIIRAEKVSGKSREGRDELASIMEFIRPGDELCVMRLCRLGRLIRDLLNIVHDLQQRGAALTVLELFFSTKDAAGAILLTVLAMVSEVERNFLLERQRVGIEPAKKAEVTRGRKPSLPVEKIRDMRTAGHGPTAIARALGISRMSVHRALQDGHENGARRSRILLLATRASLITSISARP